MPPRVVHEEKVEDPSTVEAVPVVEAAPVTESTPLPHVAELQELHSRAPSLLLVPVPRPAPKPAWLNRSFSSSGFSVAVGRVSPVQVEIPDKSSQFPAPSPSQHANLPPRRLSTPSIAPTQNGPAGPVYEPQQYGPFVPAPQSLAAIPTAYLEELMARATKAVLAQNSLPPQVDNSTHDRAPVHHHHNHNNRQITLSVNLPLAYKENLLKRTLKRV